MEIITVLNRLDTKRIEYVNGIIISRHTPRFEADFDISGDKHSSRLTLESPVDGYGKPSIWLSFLREACVNGAVAYHKNFKTQINYGSKDAAAYTVERVMQAYNNEDGYIALKNRLENAQKSWSSIYEVRKLAKLIWKLENQSFKDEYIKDTYPGVTDLGKDKLRNDILQQLYILTGNIREIYGVVNIDSISEKKMKGLPTQAKVYDLLNFATEAASHWLRPTAARIFQGYFGSLVSQDYDLEGSAERVKEFKDFLGPKPSNSLLVSKKQLA